MRKKQQHQQKCKRHPFEIIVLSLPVPRKISMFARTIRCQHLQEIAIEIKCQSISRVIHIEMHDQHGIEQEINRERRRDKWVGDDNKPKNGRDLKWQRKARRRRKEKNSLTLYNLQTLLQHLLDAASIPRPASDEFEHRLDPSSTGCSPTPACPGSVMSSPDSRSWG